jgi:hypothetical protein
MPSRHIMLLPLPSTRYFEHCWLTA